MLERDTAHEKIISEVTDKVEEISSKIKAAINYSVEELKDNKVPSAGSACISYIRNIRKNVLLFYQPVKLQIYNIISRAMIQESRVPGIDQLLNLTNEINAVNTVRAKAIEMKTAISTYDIPLPDYKKFLLYGKPDEKRKRNIDNSDKNTKKENSGITIRKYKNGFLIGIVITLIFAAIDGSIMYSVFMAANMSEVSSVFFAVISAVVLDAPPYILGILGTKRNDKRRLWELRQEVGDSGSLNESKNYKQSSKILLIAIVLIFLTYMALRVLLFLGGGDFDFALHALFKRKFDFETIKFEGADFMSTVVPIGTSAMAYAIGMLLSPSYTDYVKKTVAIIDRKLQLRIRECEETILNCDEKCKNLNSEIASLKQEIWTFYLGNASVPQDDVTFKKQVAFAFKRLNLEQYSETYKVCCYLLRNKAEEAIEHVKVELTRYAANQEEITSMEISDEERVILDDFWAIASDESQNQLTVSHMKAIKDLENSLWGN